MSGLIDALMTAGDGAFAVDEDLRIIYWNDAAEAILGFDRQGVTGQFCYQLFRGFDEERHLVCKQGCPLAKLALRSKPVPNYDVQVRTKQGESCWLNMSVIAPEMGDNGNKKMIVHLFRDISQKKNDEMFFRQILETARRYSKTPHEIDDGGNSHHLVENLTGREREVLILLTRGLSTCEVAGTLFISRNTARNHIQNILSKLQVHSRLEAVTYAMNNGVLGSKRND